MPDQISNFLQSTIINNEFYSASYRVCQSNSVRYAGSVGNAVSTPEVIIPATENTIYDLASLTKPLVIGLLTAILWQENLLDLETDIVEFFPEFQNTDKEKIKVWHLLAHCSGFAAWRPLYALASSMEEVIDIIVQTKSEYELGTHVIYSDLGFIILGFLLEKITNTTLDRLFEIQVAKPLNLQLTKFNPPLSWLNQIAMTEIGNRYERELSCSLTNLTKKERQQISDYSGWRSELIWGQVHDANAHFLGGVAGHAGLFSTASEVCSLALQFLSGSKLLNDKTLQFFTKSLTSGLNEERSVAWMLAKTSNSTAGSKLSENAFGHTGFTGTSLWIDPQKIRIHILLANRVYPIKNINKVRREFNNLSVKVLDKKDV